MVTAKLRLLAAAGLAFVTVSARAMSPDGRFDLSVGGSFAIALPEQTARLDYGVAQVEATDRGTNYFDLGLNLLWGVADPLSVYLAAGLGSLSADSKAKVVSGGTGQVVDLYKSDRRNLSTGVHLFPAALWLGGYDPRFDLNPDGPWLCPLIGAEFIQSGYGASNKTSEASGGFNGYNNDFLDAGSTKTESFYLSLPLAKVCSLNLDYNRDLSREWTTTPKSGAVKSGSDGGFGEGFGYGLSFFYRPPTTPTDFRAFVPRIGPKGSMRFDLGLGRYYDLRNGRVNSNNFYLGVFGAMTEHLSLGATFRSFTYQHGNYDGIGNATVVNEKKDERDLSLSLTYAWASLPSAHRVVMLP